MKFKDKKITVVVFPLCTGNVSTACSLHDAHSKFTN